MAPGPPPTEPTTSARDQADVEAARAALAEAEEKGTMSWEEFKASLGR